MTGIKIGLIGCGEWGKNILRDLKTLNCYVKCICQSKQSYAYAKAAHADEIFDSCDQLQQVDGVVIATPSSTHANVIDQIAHLNIPIFVEKPFTVNLDDAERLTHHLQDRLFVMHKWRYHVGIQTLAHIVKTKELGEILGLYTKRVNSKNNHADVDIVWTYLPHELSIAIEIFGQIFPPKRSVAVEWQNETVELIGMLGEKPWHMIEVSSIRPHSEREIRIICELGVAVLKEDCDTEIVIYKKNPHTANLEWNERRQFVNNQSLFCELQAFINYIKGGEKPKSDAKEGLATVQTIVALRQLAKIKFSGVLNYDLLSQGEVNVA